MLIGAYSTILHYELTTRVILTKLDGSSEEEVEMSQRGCSLSHHNGFQHTPFTLAKRKYRSFGFAYRVT